MDFLKHVPDGFTLRKPQEQILRILSEAWDQADNFVVHAPVGVGKSLIAMTISNAVMGSHILTPAKDLQTQYINAFEDGVALVAGRGNYDCCFEQVGRYHTIREIIDRGRIPPRNYAFKSCGAKECACKTAGGKLDCMSDGIDICPFELAILRGQESPITVHNMMGFCYHAEMANKFGVRDAIIVDEAHSLEDVLRSVGTQEIELTHKEAERARAAIKDLVPAQDITGLVESFKYDRSILDLPFPGYNLDYRYAEVRQEHGKGARLALVPKYTAALAQKHVLDFGTKRVFMSGSIADYEHFTESLRLPKATTAKINMLKSPFPVENRLIKIPKNHLVDMSSRERKTSAPLLDIAIRKILSMHPNQKGVIHTTSYAVSADIADRLMDTGRIMAPRGGHEHKRVFEAFLRSKSNHVFISPSISEGVDLKYDLARFQIVTTLSVTSPTYKSVYGPVGYNKMSIRQSMETLMQQVGRVTRAEDDTGVTYIVDSRVLSLVKKNFPDWFREAVRIVDI